MKSPETKIPTIHPQEVTRMDAENQPTTPKKDPQPSAVALGKRRADDAEDSPESVKSPKTKAPTIHPQEVTRFPSDAELASHHERVDKEAEQSASADAGTPSVDFTMPDWSPEKRGPRIIWPNADPELVKSMQEKLWEDIEAERKASKDSGTSKVDPKREFDDYKKQNLERNTEEIKRMMQELAIQKREEEKPKKDDER